MGGADPENAIFGVFGPGQITVSKIAFSGSAPPILIFHPHPPKIWLMKLFELDILDAPLPVPDWKSTRRANVRSKGRR